MRLKAEHAHRYDAPGDGVFAPELLRRLSVAAEGEATVTCDVGQHQMWVAQHCLIRRPERHLTSGGLGAMGYGLPAAIGAQLADPARTTIAVSGDGSIMINIQELATLKRYGIPVRVLLIDNQSLGMVRQWQELFFERRFSEVDLSDNPDFAAVARSFGIDALTLDDKGQVDEAIDALLHHPGPLFVHCRIDPAANVWPLVPPGHTNATMLEGSTQ
jgi:acetolactate synthase-1/2/3 large subunit